MTIGHLVNVGKTNPKRTQNEPKQSQMQKSPNERKYCFNKGLQRKMNNEGLRKTNPKQTQTKPNQTQFQKGRRGGGEGMSNIEQVMSNSEAGQVIELRIRNITRCSIYPESCIQPGISLCKNPFLRRGSGPFCISSRALIESAQG